MENSKGIPHRIKQGLRPSPVLGIVCLLILVLPSLVQANPSGQTWSVEGGGFCSGDYTVYNFTGTVYAMNCSTGVNDFTSSTDAGAVVTSAIGNLPNCGKVDFRAGLFSLVTPINFAGKSGCTLNGVGTDNSDPPYPAFTLERNGTTLVAQTGGMRMIEATSSPLYSCCGGAGGGSRCLAGTTVSNLELFSNNKAAIGLDFSCAEEGGLMNLIYHIQAMGCRNNSGCTGFTTAAIIMDGNEDSFIEDTRAGQCGGCNSITDNAVDVQWRSGAGNVNIVNDVLVGNINVYTCAQTVFVSGTTISSIKLFAGGSGCPTDSVWNLDIIGGYYANAIDAGNVQLNGQTLEVFHITGDFVLLSSTKPMFAGPGTVINAGFSGCTFNFNPVSVWTTGSPTLTKLNTDGTNHVHSGVTPSGFPFTIDGNGNF